MKIIVLIYLFTMLLYFAIKGYDIYLNKTRFAYAKYDKKEIIDMLSYLFKISKQINISFANEDDLDNQVEVVQKEVQEFNTKISDEIDKLSLKETLTFSAKLIYEINDEIVGQSRDLLEQLKRKSYWSFDKGSQNNNLNYEEQINNEKLLEDHNLSVYNHHILIKEYEDNIIDRLDDVMWCYKKYNDTSKKSYYFAALIESSFAQVRTFLVILDHYKVYTRLDVVYRLLDVVYRRLDVKKLDT